MAQCVMVELSHPHHCLRCSGLVHASNNRRGLRWNRQVNSISRSEGRLTVTSTFFPTSMLRSSPCCYFSQKTGEPVHAVLPRPAISIKPLIHFAQRSTLKTTRPRLSLAASSDQARAFQNLEMFGDRRGRDEEGLRE